MEDKIGNDDKNITQSIFITNSDTEEEIKDISGRVTATCILNTIPPQATSKKIDNWEDSKKTEWRWRFLEFDDKRTVEISYKHAGKDKKRKYYNRFGEWVERDVPKEYDEFVVKTFYYYN